MFIFCKVIPTQQSHTSEHLYNNNMDNKEASKKYLKIKHLKTMNTTTEPEVIIQRVRLVERWVQTAIRVQDTFGKIENAFMASPENEIRSAIWDMFGEYTRTLAEQLSDDAEDARGWLEWFAWECDFGKAPKEMQFSDGETLLVVGVSDLLAAIRPDDHGNRVRNTPANAKGDAPGAIEKL